MERTRKRKNIDTAIGTRDDEIHDAEMEVPIINLVHESRNASSRVDQGGPDLDVALNWIAQIETKFKVLRFSENVKVQVVISFLVGDAKNWWKSMKPIINVAENDTTWEEFKEMFLDQYFLRALRKKRQNDFYSLRFLDGKLDIRRVEKVIDERTTTGGSCSDSQNESASFMANECSSDDHAEGKNQAEHIIHHLSNHIDIAVQEYVQNGGLCCDLRLPRASVK
ncbi:hypothetical protein ACH5RR_019350 [Cinchona calisaya]|uniref:Retrotransposon gag domain-containing protein n=1 Tax=Cinchona calisaya TaxID=153742 RepID=A0ABD2ZQV3_9GENT